MNEMTQVLGTVAMEPKGEYNAETYYEKLNTVLYNDSTYMAKEAVFGEIPSTSSKWQLIGGGVTKEYLEDQTIDNLDSSSATKPLSAKQGNNLNKAKVEVFDTVALMKTANLKNGMVAETLGYYSVNDEGSATYKIRNKTNDDVVNEMDIIALNDDNLIAELIINDNTINLKQFGCKSGLNNFDNKPMLENAINYINNIGGGTILIPSGEYYLLTNLTFNNRIRNIKLSGLGQFESNSGSKLLYTGNNTLFTFDELWNCTIEDLHINGNNSNNLMLINNGFYKCIIQNCTFGLFLNGIDIKRNAYSKIYNCTFNFAVNRTDNYQIRFAYNKTGLCEFLYIEQCQFGCVGENTSSNGIFILGGNNIYINNCDFADLGDGRGIIINSKTGIIGVYINNINVIRTKGIELYTNSDDMTNIFLDNMIFYFSGYATKPLEDGIYAHVNGGRITTINFKNIQLRQLADASGCTFGNINGYNGYIGITSNFTSATIDTGSWLRLDYEPLKNSITNKTISAYADGTNVVTAIINETSPYNRMPIILLEPTSNLNDNYIIRYTTETNAQGKIVASIYYNSNIANGTLMQYSASII